MGSKVVVLCDDLHKFMRDNREENERFLRNLAGNLNNQTTLTFIGTSRLDWDAKSVLGSDSVVALGWD